MKLDTVIFDMDGLLIDSEPLWGEAADEMFKLYGVTLSKEQYTTTTGLRTKEFVQWWFRYFKIAEEELINAETNIIQSVLNKVRFKGKIMPGVRYILDFFKHKGFKIGLASSSPLELINLVIDLIDVRDYIDAIASAESLPYGKPHPQVYLNCANTLSVNPAQCICFEDSFNGMIAAKAATMKCIVVPHQDQLKDKRWGAADLMLASLQHFNTSHLSLIQH